MSVYGVVGMCAPLSTFFSRGLSLALRSHDQYMLSTKDLCFLDQLGMKSQKTFESDSARLRNNLDPCRGKTGVGTIFMKPDFRLKSTPE